MNTCIKTRLEMLALWFDKHPKIREWVWFTALWLGGLMAVTAMAYPIKWLMSGL